MLGVSALSIAFDLISTTIEYGIFVQYKVGVVNTNCLTERLEEVYIHYGKVQDKATELAVKTIKYTYEAMNVMVCRLGYR